MGEKLDWEPRNIFDRSIFISECAWQLTYLLLHVEDDEDDKREWVALQTVCIAIIAKASLIKMSPEIKLTINFQLKACYVILLSLYLRIQLLSIHPLANYYK